MRWLFWIVVVAAVLALVAYFGAGYVVYDQLTDLSTGCARHGENQPDHFTNVQEWPAMDLLSSRASTPTAPPAPAQSAPASRPTATG